MLGTGSTCIFCSSFPDTVKFYGLLNTFLTVPSLYYILIHIMCPVPIVCDVCDVFVLFENLHFIFHILGRHSNMYLLNIDCLLSAFNTASQACPVKV